MSGHERFLPLTPLSLAVLVALADEDRHGYGILKEIEARDGDLRPGTGTLYAALQRMLDEGLIEAAGGGRRAGEDARRRYYGITELGRSVARAELERVARLLELGASKRLVGGLRAARLGPDASA